MFTGTKKNWFFKETQSLALRCKCLSCRLRYRLLKIITIEKVSFVSLKEIVTVFILAEMFAILIKSPRSARTQLACILKLTLDLIRPRVIFWVDVRELRYCTFIFICLYFCCYVKYLNQIKYFPSVVCFLVFPIKY